jgi:hypothetical protein
MDVMNKAAFDLGIEDAMAKMAISANFIGKAVKRANTKRLMEFSKRQSSLGGAKNDMATRQAISEQIKRMRARSFANRALGGALVGGAAGGLAGGEDRRLRGALIGAGAGAVWAPALNFAGLGPKASVAASAALAGLTGRSQAKAYDGFKGTLKVNPNSKELDTAMAAYRRETGKDPSNMSFEDINKYVLKARKSR